MRLKPGKLEISEPRPVQGCGLFIIKQDEEGAPNVYTLF